MTADLKDLRTDELVARLKRHYIPPSGMPGGVFVPECGKNGTFGASGRCDALYAGFTSASGRILIGHEVKVSRADWLHELKSIGKADEWADQCHAWYLVVSDPGIVHDGELPAGWGLMAPTSRTRTRLTILTAAKVHHDRTPSWDAVRSMMARLDTLMTQEKHAHVVEVDKTIESLVQKRLAARPARREMTADDAHRLASLDALEQRLGVSVSEWDLPEYARPERLAAALELLNVLDTPSSRHGGLGRLADDLERMSGTLRDGKALVDQLVGVSK